ncbi:MAG: type II toxin-antitoxin system RelE/ParE family toxin [Candidatus Melainabacteria bacterium]|nr:type II toxin-antitoxin system RelE/ParE family toxin [Candidatus Melainabacteria bacterium]
MANYKVEITSSARKEIKNLDKEAVKRIIEKLESLSNDPYPDGCKKLRSDLGYRIRVGDYRIIYDIDHPNLVIKISRVRHRKDAYR